MDWDHLKYFLTIAKSGSLSRAAKALKVNHSTVSRRLHTLEKQLKTQLFNKSIEGVKLTSSGEKLLKYALEMEKQVDRAKQSLEGQVDKLCGKIRVTTEDTLGLYVLPELLTKFQKKHPLIIIDLNISSKYANLSHREADVAITTRKKPPDYLVGRDLGSIQMTLAASKKYLQRFSKPKTSKDLANHHFLCPNETLGHLKATRWLHQHIPEEKIIFMADKFSTLFKMTVQGNGISLLPHYIIKTHKDLVPIMNLPERCGSQAWILTHPDIKNTVTIQTFIKYVGDTLRL